ncbi:MAG: antibiotic biosynthesis monooxygenase [Clostridiales bacterium]|jgi:quinol monooxygenase YgiN|nr:antibiotic biosynthesis monooxygenase [Clostridiales bacterium]
MVSVFAPNYVKKENIETFKSMTANLVAETQKEAGCISYNLYQDVNDPQVLAFVELWQSREALGAHMQTPHFKEIVPKLGELKDPLVKVETRVMNLIEN